MWEVDIIGGYEKKKLLAYFFLIQASLSRLFSEVLRGLTKEFRIGSKKRGMGIKLSCFLGIDLICIYWFQEWGF